LIEKLDYLKWLGVDCLWLPPFYDSPLRDAGYDIRDFYKVLPEFGTVEDFVALIDAAHRRGIRVITDLVMNHTSDAHRWFQESRHHPEGPYGAKEAGEGPLHPTIPAIANAIHDACGIWLTKLPS
jgi:maltose alpha-D-glucosyltransferase/alpha-amylase